MFHPQLPILIILYLFLILNHSILSFAGNFPTPNYHDNIANYDYCHLDNNLARPNYVPPAPKQRKLAFGRVNMVATIVIIVITLLNIIVYKLRKLQEANFYEQFDIPHGQLCRRFLLNDILLATNHFDDALVIGQGGFGKVYKGVIDNGTITVAIKRLNRTSHQGAPEFWTEVEMLSKFRHSHLVSLLGYCNNCNEMILVYEYMIHGTVADHLYKIGRNGNNSTLSWVQRLKICIGAARGLDYLHTGTGIQHRVIHRDVKSSNILLDENWAAKISDFGMSKTGPANQSCTHISTNVKGTFGYLDPEYFLTRRLTRKSDVYAFGVVLFEVLCGRRAVDTRLDEEQWGLAGWAQKCIKDGRLEHIIDPSLKWEIFPNSLNAFSQIANQCLHYRSKERPTMAEVVAALESALALQQKRDSSMVEMEIFDICGTYENQENADSSMDKQGVTNANSSTEQQEVIGAGNGVHEEQIDASSMQEKIDENLDYCRGKQEVIGAGNGVHEEEQIDASGIQEKIDENLDSRRGKHEVIGAGNGVHEEEQIDGSSMQEKIDENLDSRRGKHEVVNVVNEDKHIDEIMGLGDPSSRLPPVKRARIMEFTRMVRQFFHGTAQVTSVHSTAKPPKSSKSSNNNGESNGESNGEKDVQQLPLSRQTETRDMKMFTYSALQTATVNFAPRFLIGEGDFGKVFKVWVNEKTYAPSKFGVGRAVTIKKFNLNGFQEEIHWQSEVELLEKLSHPNIVEVLGYCLENEEFLLVSEYMEKGSLERYLFSRNEKPLSWVTRINVAVGAARGFAFLHSTEKKNIYRQFKTHNILLDQDFNAKISDIQLSEISYSFGEYYFPGLRRVVVHGTDYYLEIPPEYITIGHLNQKGHVYCFGVVLLEILTGMRVSALLKRSGHRKLMNSARDLLSDKQKMSRIIDPRLGGVYPIKDAFQYAQLTVKCLDSTPENRPLMEEILKTLEGMNKES